MQEPSPGVEAVRGVGGIEVIPRLALDAAVEEAPGGPAQLHRVVELYVNELAVGESLNDVRARFLPFLDALVGLYRATNATIALVAHGSLLGNLLPDVCANVPADAAQRYGMPNAEPIVVEVRPRGLLCVEWAGQALGETTT